ncbi:MAG: TIGR04283 family arsenosugar biosynthesis glycosyltransferase [Vicinamibacterales bacterium]
MSHVSPAVSVVIPTRGDAAPLARLLDDLLPADDLEVIVSRSGPEDPTELTLRAARPDVHWVDTATGRGPQLNAGAALARGRWLWFVHADCRVPSSWRAAFAAVDAAAPVVVGGSFAFALDSPAWQARLLERAVAWRVRWFDLPYGDQGIFVRREVFTSLGGFQPWPLMEDVDFVRRLTRRGPVRHLTEQVVSSARRWERDGWWKRSGANLMTLCRYFAGVPPERLARSYERRSTLP